MWPILVSLPGQGAQWKGAENRGGRTNGSHSAQYLNQTLGTVRKVEGDNTS